MSGMEGDKYRSYLHGEGKLNTNWRYGGPPNYDIVNKLFEDERTKVWPSGSLEEKVQNLVKSWEMEIFHKASLEKPGGGDNPQLQTSLPEELRCYDPEKETDESSHKAFVTTFPRGFAFEVLKVYTGPPEIVLKFDTGVTMKVLSKVDEDMKIGRVEFFYERGELLGGLLKGAAIDSSAMEAASSCPILRNTG
ncbi:hypothetical protein Golax_010024 [Gossypium laxum]|uniref:Pathogen-related protein n=1 Tax=Gossypium laxum TaxID=34288 RepID=A0A7J8ZFY5_9ROSI|nr:hypothetical protein [Gossypium laxum]